MRNIKFIIFTLIVLVSCQKDLKKDTYIINGVVNNISDGTMISIEVQGMNVIDSTAIIGGTFQFTGKVERPTLVMLRIKNTKDHRMFWLENQKININGEKGNLKNSKVIGSKTQKEADILIARKDSIYKEYDRIDKLVTNSNRDSLFVVYNQIIDKEIEINNTFIKEYPNSYESVFRLNFSKEKMNSEETRKLLSQMSEEIQSTKEGKSILDYLELHKNLKIGDTYIDFTQVNTKGKSIKLSEIMGKYTLLEFWASYCGPCRSFNPELIKEYDIYKDKGFVIIGISLDTDKEKWLNAIEKDGLKWENISDLKGSENSAAMIYGVADLPDNFLIDENGIIIGRYLRGDNLKKKLKELFKE